MTNENLKYLFDFKDGKIKKGLTIDCILDDYFVYKQGEFNMILGLDNVGKTNWIIWYLTTLVKKYNKKFAIWSGENKTGQIIRDIIQFWTGTNLKELKKSQIEFYHNIIIKHFFFIPNNRLYDHKQLLEIFNKLEIDGALIDPYTGLNHNRRVAQFERNYEVCNDVRKFCNETKKSIYISIHPQTESARRVYPPDHILNGHIQPPRKADCEGGQVFPNRVDNFICLHRLINSKELWHQTEVHVYKIKDKETGGKPTNLGEPLRFDWNQGLGFTIGGINPIKQIK